jgi:hypothetical protein
MLNAYSLLLEQSERCWYMKIEVSNGELVDKVSILSIKIQKFKSSQKRSNVQREYDLLLPLMKRAGISESSTSFQRLMDINRRLWEIEDQIRQKESLGEFDQSFIQLARSVYVENDKRFQVKREINEITGSHIIEEKEYVDYR